MSDDLLFAQLPYMAILACAIALAIRSLRLRSATVARGAARRPVVVQRAIRACGCTVAALHTLLLVAPATVGRWNLESTRLRAVEAIGAAAGLVLSLAPLNLVTNARGLPVDASGAVVGRDNPHALPQFRDLNGNGDLYDDAFLRDTRLRPLPNAGAALTVDRYSIVIPANGEGPIAVTAAVYYQSVEAIVAKKFLGNLADTDGDFVLEPCVLSGPCDGRVPASEPAVVEGAPPVPVSVRNATIAIDGHADRQPPRVTGTYPRAGADGVFQDVVVKAFFAAPVRDLTDETFTLHDSAGNRVPASVAQIADGAWALFPDAVFLETGGRYTARVKHGLCSDAGGCMRSDLVWQFTVSSTRGTGMGDTTVPVDFGPARAAPTATLPARPTSTDPVTRRPRATYNENIAARRQRSGVETRQ